MSPRCRYSKKHLLPRLLLHLLARLLQHQRLLQHLLPLSSLNLLPRTSASVLATRTTHLLLPRRTSWALKFCSITLEVCSCSASRKRRMCPTSRLRLSLTSRPTCSRTCQSTRLCTSTLSTTSSRVLQPRHTRD